MHEHNAAVNTATDISRSQEDKTRIYVFVRTDLVLPQQAVQVGHAAAEAGSLFYRPAEHGVASLILLQVADDKALRHANNLLAERGIQSIAFFEPDQDATQLPGSPVGYSAIGTQPVPISDWGFFRKWRLWNGAKHGLPRASAAVASAAAS